jgi:hypothetical protein
MDSWSFEINFLTQNGQAFSLEIYERLQQRAFLGHRIFKTVSQDEGLAAFKG